MKISVSTDVVAGFIYGIHDGNEFSLHASKAIARHLAELEEEVKMYGGEEPTLDLEHIAEHYVEFATAKNVVALHGQCVELTGNPEEQENMALEWLEHTFKYVLRTGVSVVIYID